MSKEDHLSPEACRLINWLLGKSVYNEDIGQVNSGDKHNILLKIEEDHFMELYNPYKKICKKFEIPYPMEAEIMLFCHNMILPRLYKLAGLAGMDPKDYAKEQIITLAEELDMLLENNETTIKLQNAKQKTYDEQSEMITFTPASQMS